ncbi:hypothetical protein BRADI_1g61695v3 [Brachypodium distachyon]|uniref:Uncharacterized protein n=1 Tax=Brachypodium distachyon TaxID=15368 RepID=A0A2K2DSX2_BRADI|nr:hypothetical protein BRADI_1g61695v3 [Brachypodium distachyon]
MEGTRKKGAPSPRRTEREARRSGPSSLAAMENEEGSSLAEPYVAGALVVAAAVDGERTLPTVGNVGAGCGGGDGQDWGREGSGGQDTEEAEENDERKTWSGFCRLLTPYNPSQSGDSGGDRTREGHSAGSEACSSSSGDRLRHRCRFRGRFGYVYQSEAKQDPTETSLNIKQKLYSLIDQSPSNQRLILLATMMYWMIHSHWQIRRYHCTDISIYWIVYVLL